MDKRYKHLNGEDSGVILAAHGHRAIGTLPGCRASPIGRELRRGCPVAAPQPAVLRAAWRGPVAGAAQALRVAAQAGL